VSLTSGDGGRKETGRVEAFSDGVFAIAMTLLWHKRCAGRAPASQQTRERT